MTSLSEQNFPRSAKVEPGLGGTLVGTGLQPDQAFAGPQLLLGKLPAVLLRGPWTEVRAAELRVAVARTSNREDGSGDQRDVLLVPQIRRLEQVHVGDAILDTSFLKLADVVHHFVVAAAGVNFRHDAGRKAVHQAAQQNAVPQAVLVGESGGELFAEQRLDPVLGFAFLVLVALSGDLPQWTSRHSAVVLVVDEENGEAVGR